MADRQIVQARAPFNASIGGRPVSVGTGDLYYDDDPMVVGRERLFEPPRVRVTPVVVERPRVRPRAPETMTATPSGDTRAPVTETGRKRAAAAAAPAGSGAAQPDGEV